MRYATAALFAMAALGLPASASAESETRPGGAEGLGVAYRALQEGAYEKAFAVATALDPEALEAGDYAHFAAGQAAYLTGRYKRAHSRFRRLARDRRSRFRARARWRLADSLWQLERPGDARTRYERLLRRHPDAGDKAAAQFRIGEAHRLAGDTDAAIEAYRELRLNYPQHPLEPRATQRLSEIGGPDAASLSAADRLKRGLSFGENYLWQRAHREVWSIGAQDDEELDAERHYWTAMTLYRQRRQYRRAGDILLAHYADMGDRGPRALFHGARALSRADDDDEAIDWYLRVVEEYPRSRWAPQAQFLAGWLEYNMGNYRAAIELLERVRDRYPRSRWVRSARWFLGFSHALVGDHDTALPYFERMAAKEGAMYAGKGAYWKARSLQELGRDTDARAAYRELVGRYPFSWYALLSRARLAEKGTEIAPFGDDPRSPDDAPPLAETPREALSRAPLIRRADELLRAGLETPAGLELERGERRLLRRHGRRHALAVLLERYREADNYHRPWRLAVTYGGTRALSAPAKGRARVWWKHAYPLAFDDIVEAWRKTRDLPKYYVHAIMRKESGFDPHARSYADARGLVQIIPRTTRRIAAELDIPYTDDMLWDPETNVRIGSWYLGGLFEKFRQQVPLAAGSFNSGPLPVMRWIDRHGDRPMDELVELVPYRQTRKYMKLVTETYARYRYLYAGELYEQPLDVDTRYLDNDLNY